MVNLMSTQSLCTFRVDQLHLGVDVLQVQEVIRPQAMTRTPLADATVRGLMNLRGQIVTAFDLRRRLGLPDRTDDAPPMNVVVRTPDGPVSLLVDEIGDVLEVSQDQFETTPDTLQGVARELIQGPYKMDGRLLLLLDIARTLHRAA